MQVAVDKNRNIFTTEDHDVDPQRRLKALAGGIHPHISYAIDVGAEDACVHQNWRFAFVIGMEPEAAEICGRFSSEECKAHFRRSPYKPSQLVGSSFGIS